MAAQTILPIDISGGIDESRSGGLGAPVVADMDHVRIQCSGDLSSAPGYAVGLIATSDAVSPTTGQLVACASTVSGGTVGLIHQGDDMYMARLAAGSSQARYWQRITQYETSADVPQLCGCTTRMLGSPPVSPGSNEVSLCSATQVHAGALGILAVTGNTTSEASAVAGIPTPAQWSWVQKGVLVSSGYLTWSGAPGLYGVCPIIRDGYLVAMFGSYTATTWNGSLVAWRLSDWVSLTAVPAPVWTEALTSGALGSVLGAPVAAMSLSPDGDRLAVFLSSRLYIRRFSVPGTVISALTATAVVNADVIWDSGSSTVWAAYQGAALALTVARYSTAAAVTHGPTVVTTMFEGTGITWARALGYVHLIASGVDAFAVDNQMLAFTFTETGSTSFVGGGPLDVGNVASRPIMVSADRGYVISTSFSNATSVLRSTYAIEMRFASSAPRIVGEIAGVALEGATPARAGQATWYPSISPQLSSIALAITDLQWPSIGHFLEGEVLPRYLVGGAVVSSTPFISVVGASVPFDPNLRSGCLLSWEVQDASTVGVYGRGLRARSVLGGALLSHGAPLWITPLGRDMPGFAEGMPSHIGVSSAGGSLVAGTYQIVTVAERIDGLGLRHQSAPSYPKSYTVGTNDRIQVVVPQIPAVWGRTNVGGSSTTLAASVSVYMTRANGATFYLVKQGSLPMTTLTLAFQPAGTELVLYTDTGQRPRYSPPSCTCIAIGKERALAGGLWRDTEVRFSLLIVAGEGLAWPPPGSPQWTAQLPSPVLSVAAFGDAWAVFCSTGIYIIQGDGPDDTGAGGTFSSPSRISLLQLASDRSVVEADEGVYFQARDAHMYLMQAGSGQCVRVTEKIRDSFGASRLPTSGPTWQSVMGACLGGPNSDLYIVQWGNPYDTGSFVGRSTVWVYSRPTGTWTRDVVSTYQSASFLSPTVGVWPVTLPGNGETVMWATRDAQQAFESVSSTLPTYTPTASVTTNWLAPFGPLGDGHVSSIAIVAGYPNRRERLPGRDISGTGLADFLVAVSRDLETDTTQTDTLSPWPGLASSLHDAPQWRTAEMALRSPKGRVLQVEIKWTDTRVSLSGLALQGNGFARFERVPDARSGVPFGT